MSAEPVTKSQPFHPASFEWIPIGAVMEHPANPRKNFDKAQLENLTASVKQAGVLNPLLVRPRIPKPGPGTGMEYEILAGHRRYRAAKQAGLTSVPAIVRELDDRAAMEVMLVDNLQRTDLHPLEEADGYRQLMAVGKYDAARIAERVGRSAKYIYDRVRLLHLTKEAQAFFRDGKFSAGHAILLARLNPSDQKRAIGTKDPDSYHGPYSDGGLFEVESPLFHPDKEGRGEAPVKARTVRELEGWIDEHVRFDTESELLPDLWPETTRVLEEAQEQEEEVVKITYDYQLRPEARDPKERTYGPQSWKRADGKQGAGFCESAVTGVIVAGPGRGEAFKVCVDKKGCTKHWGAELRKAAKRAKQVAAGGKTGEDRYELQRRKDEERRKLEDALRAPWVKAAQEITRALADAVRKANATAAGPLAGLLVEKRPSPIPPGKTAEDLVRHLAFRRIARELAGGWHEYYRREVVSIGKHLRVDVAKIVDQFAPPAETAKTAAPAKAKPKGKKA